MSHIVVVNPGTNMLKIFQNTVCKFYILYVNPQIQKRKNVSCVGDLGVAFRLYNSWVSLYKGV